MATEEELLKREQALLKKARTTATVFGILAIVALIAFVYAFFQGAAAEKAALAVINCERNTAEAEARADLANKKVEQLTIELQIAKEVADDANNSNKKK